MKYGSWPDAIARDALYASLIGGTGSDARLPGTSVNQSLPSLTNGRNGQANRQRHQEYQQQQFVEFSGKQDVRKSGFASHDSLPGCGLLIGR